MNRKDRVAVLGSALVLRRRGFVVANPFAQDEDVKPGRGVEGFAPLAIGRGLTLIHLVSIPVTNTSVNPARSTGVALFAGEWAVRQLWLFCSLPWPGRWSALSSTDGFVNTKGEAGYQVHFPSRESPSGEDWACPFSISSDPTDPVRKSDASRLRRQ